MKSWTQSTLESFQQREKPYPTVADKDTTWEEYERRAAFTKNLEYDCQFKPNGACRSYPDPKTRNGMACCGGCMYSLGYLESIPPGTARYYAKLFLKKTGFWRPGKGCVLPRKRRSAVCLNYRCASPKYDIKSETLRPDKTPVYWLNQQVFYVWNYLASGNTKLIQIALKDKS